MNRKRAWVAVGMVAMLMGGGFLVFPPSLFAQEKTIVWNIPHTAAPSYYHILNLKLFAEKVKEKSKGRMEIRVHPASSLYPQNEQIPAVVDGRVEIAPMLSGYMVDMFLEMAVLDLPFMTSSLDETRAAAEKLQPLLHRTAGAKEYPASGHRNLAHPAALLHEETLRQSRRLEGNQDSRVRLRNGGTDQGPGRGAGQYSFRRGLYGSAEKRGRRGHHFGHECRAHEILRSDQVYQLLVHSGRGR